MRCKKSNRSHSSESGYVLLAVMLAIVRLPQPG
jgi:hypothetical protein